MGLPRTTPPAVGPTPETAVQAAEQEKRLRQQQAFRQYLVSEKYAVESMQWWRPIDRDMDQDDLRFDTADSSLAVLSETVQVKGMMKDGLYKKEGVDFAINVKDGAFSTSPMPKNLEEFKQHYSELMKAVALGKGSKQITFDYPLNSQGTNSNISLDEVMAAIDIAKEQGLTIKLGPNLQAVLADPYKHLPNAPYDRSEWKMIKGETEPKRFLAAREEIYAKLKDLEHNQQTNSKLYETEKAVELEHHQRAIDTNQTALKQAATALAAAIDGNQPDQMKKALADLKKAEQVLEKTAKEMKTEIASLNEDGQAAISQKYAASYKAAIEGLAAASAEVKETIYPAAPGAGTSRVEIINKLADAALKAELQPETGIQATVFKPLDDAITAGKAAVDEKISAMNVKPH
jgi:paraquat-inducible protein B